MKLPYVVAEILVHAAEAEAGNLGVPMAVAIVDSEGGLQMFTRMDGALPVSTELAVSKAYTAASLRMPTDEVGKLAQPGQALYGIQHTHQGRIVLFGGGLPLCLDGEVVGAIGVSGGTVEQDVQVALPAVRTLQEIESWARKIDGFSPAHVGLESPILGRIREEVQRAFVQSSPALSRDTVDVLTGAVVLALA